MHRPPANEMAAAIWRLLRLNLHILKTGECEVNLKRVMTLAEVCA
ncbi:hypothetical protein BN2497_561 [Janthinobacterium sp. CG23_2]|nr:hypothetical protein BN2497_561 [Janthinobacterium sp. CG23_2]CUU26678.1 hypothetical protein BN3177_561 [Janthinobacterium sp. CG23_2]